MSSKKHDLEIVYSLRWKNRSKREESKEMSVVVVVYDIPSTTLNFETFKNYLLKNSGTAENDVRVYFVMENGKEYLIQSQIDFQVALYAFRRKARAGEMINLLLQRVSEQPTHKNLRHSNDVETQFDNAEATSILSTCCNADTAPKWFIAALAQLKKDIKDEITSNVSTLITSAVAEIKSPCLNAVPAQHASCSNRARAKPYKWSRKLTPQLVENITDTKVLLKSLKLENKLDKLERKASKYREKRHALQHGQKSSDNAPKSSDSEAGPSGTNSRSIGKEIKRKLEEVEPTTQKQAVDSKMGARPVSRQRSVPHMLGGEIYLHQWEVQNTGEAQWTPMTQLQYTWGSKKLIPLTQYISVPHLKPGEIGTISIRLHIPSHPGIYECYWQFLHKGRRFGDWLDVQVIVDPFDLKGHSSVLEHSGPQACHFINPSELQENVGKVKEPRQILLQEDLLLEAPTYKSLQDQDKIDRFKLLNQMGKMSLEAEAKSELLNRLIKEDDVDSDCSWASETEHFCPKGSEMVELMAPVPQCFALDSPDTTDNQAKTPAKQAAAESSVDTPDLKPNKAGSSESFDDNNNTDCASRSSVNSIKFRDEELDNIVVITVPEDEQVKEGFMYVHVDGQKVLIPKTILKSEIISAVQEFDSHLSASSSTGIAIDASETLNKSPTPSIASTIMNQDTEVNGANKPKQENLISAESFELFCDMQEYPSCAQQAVDLTVGPRDNFDTSTTIDEPLDRSNYFEANNFMSHCSAAGSCFSEFNANAERQTRMFVFPQDVPGYEVIYPTLDSNPEEATLTTDSCVAPKPNQRASVVSLEATSHPLEAVPNYQQTPVELRRSPVQSPQQIVRDTEPAVSEPASTHPPQQPIPEQTTQYPPNADSGWGPAPRPHILPEGLVSGAVSAARSVMNMIRPQSPGRWVNGHWVSSSLETPREANLQALAEMGFWNRDLNATLLARYSDDLNRVVAELVQ